MFISEIAQIRQNIAAEYMAAKWGLTGLSQGTAQHRVISTRMARMEEGHQALRALVGEHAIALVAETLEAIPEQPSRYHVQQVLRSEWGDTEDTTHLLRDIEALWHQFDVLSARVGLEAAHKIVGALPTLAESIKPS